MASSTTTRHFVLDATTAQVTCYAATYQAYHEDEFADVLHECGFEDMQVFPSLLGVPDESQRNTATAMTVAAWFSVAVGVLMLVSAELRLKLHRI